MKLFLVLLGLASLAMAKNLETSEQPPEEHPKTEPVYMESSLKNKHLVLFKLLNHITEPVMDKNILTVANRFVLEESVSLYTKPSIITDMINIMKIGMLPRGEIFTLNIERQMKEVVTMFHMLYYAKNFDAFLETACWMRMNFNEGMFVYALTVASRHREDCIGISLPAPYEIYPYYYVRADVIQKAYLIKMKKGLLDPKLSEFYGIKKSDKGVFIIDENVFDKRVALNDEDRLRYFTEDIDLNTYFYYFHVDYPFWMKDMMMNKINVHRRFEMTCYIYQQILARYYIERLCNGLGNVVELSFDKPISKGYWPWMMLHNGVQLPVRLNDQKIVKDQDTNEVNLVETYEQIIREALINGYVKIRNRKINLNSPEDIENLGQIIFGEVEELTDLGCVNCIHAYRYLLVIMKACLGLNTINSDKYFVVPSVLDSYQTALRDPVFYQLQKRLVNLILLFKKRLPSYTKNDLHFPGVKIDNVVVDKLTTYFDDYYMDITNAVVLTEDEMEKGKSDMTIFARKRRLNNKPFTVKLDVLSDKTTDAVIKIFLGPKRDRLDRLIDINSNRVNFVELDAFVNQLTPGKNTILRKSTDMHNLIRDRMMTRDLVEKIRLLPDFDEPSKGSNLESDLKNTNTGFPIRLILPKGRVGGIEMLLYVIVTPLGPIENVQKDCKDIECSFRSTVLLDKMPLGFPLDRQIDVDTFFTPNMKFVDVTIFHKAQTCDMKNRWDKYVLKNYNQGFSDMNTTNEA